MGAVVQRHTLIDPFFKIRMPGIQFPACFQLHKRKAVGVVPINFISGRKNENGPGTILACRFQKIQCANRVDAKIRVRLPGSPVMARLGSAVNDHRNIPAMLRENAGDSPGIADVNLMVDKIRAFILKFLQALPRGTLRAKEIFPHIIIDADDMKSFGMKEPDRFRTNKARSSRDQCDFHYYLSLAPWLSSGRLLKVRTVPTFVNFCSSEIGAVLATLNPKK